MLGKELLKVQNKEEQKILFLDAYLYIYVFDVTDPVNPIWVSTFYKGSNNHNLSYNIAIDDRQKRLYTAEMGWNTIYSYDISDPYNVVQLASFSDPLYTTDLTDIGVNMFDDCLYSIATGSDKIVKYNISNPNAITVSSSNSTSLSYPVDFDFYTSYIYIAERTYGQLLTYFYVGTTFLPTYTIQNDYTYSIRCIKAHSFDNVFTISGPYGKVLTVLHPFSQSPVTSVLNLPYDDIEMIEIDYTRNLLFATGNNDYICVVDISDFNNLRLLSSYNPSIIGQGILITLDDNNIMYASSYSSRSFVIIDYTNVTNFQVLSSVYNLPYSIRSNKLVKY